MANGLTRRTALTTSFGAAASVGLGWSEGVRASPNSPALSFVHQGFNRNGEIWVKSLSLPDLASLGPDRKVLSPGIASRPTSVKFSGALHIFYRTNGSVDLQNSYGLPTRGEWATNNFRPLVRQFKHDISAVAYTEIISEEAFIFYVSISDNRLKLTRLRSAPRSGLDLVPTEFGSFLVTGSPAAVVFRNEIYCFYPSVKGINYVFGRKYEGLLRWSGETKGWASSRGEAQNLTAAVINDQIVIFFTIAGRFTGIVRFDGSTWSDEGSVPIEPALVGSACSFNDRVYLACNRLGSAQAPTPSNPAVLIYTPQDQSIEMRETPGVGITYAPGACVF